VLQLWGRPHGELPGLRDVERGEGGPCKVGAWSGPKELHYGQLSRPESKTDKLSTEQVQLGEGGATLSEGGVLSKPLLLLLPLLLTQPLHKSRRLGSLW
jgi:hypothetical protein